MLKDKMESLVKAVHMMSQCPAIPYLRRSRSYSVSAPSKSGYSHIATHWRRGRRVFKGVETSGDLC